MLSQKINNALNMQIRAELYASHLYLSMSTYCQSINLSGFAHWMRQQSEEERSHAMRLLDYVQDRGGRVILQAIEQPPSEFNSGLGVFQQALEHERSVTKLIHELYRQAIQESDSATEVELQWFIKEQVEEEKTTGDVVARLEMTEDDPTALLIADRELASRG
jgi:ferritin